MKSLGVSTPIQFGAVITLLGTVLTGALFVINIASENKVNAAQIQAHEEQIKSLNEKQAILEDVRRDVAVIRYRVEHMGGR